MCHSLPFRASGSRLTAILYEGVPWLAGGDTPLAGLGSFSADITSDDFSLTETIRQGWSWLDPTGSTVERPVAIVPPGIHALVLYVGKGLGPYTDWVPGSPVDRACVRFLTVSKSPHTDVWGAVVVYGPEAPQSVLALNALPVCLQR